MTSPVSAAHSGGVCPFELRKRLLEVQETQERERFISVCNHVRGVVIIMLIFYLALSRTRLF